MIVALVLMVAMPMFAERVTPETASKVATTFLNNNGAKAAQLTDLSKEAGFTNLYIFNGNPGFVVMAADDCVQPILGYSLTGKFVTENMPTNISGWLQGYNDEIQYAIDNKLKASAETIQLWKDLTEGNKSNNCCGCVDTDHLGPGPWLQQPLPLRQQCKRAHCHGLCCYSHGSNHALLGISFSRSWLTFLYTQHPSRIRHTICKFRPTNIQLGGYAALLSQC